jgi:hypothetical protein
MCEDDPEQSYKGYQQKREEQNILREYYHTADPRSKTSIANSKTIK